MTHKNAVNSFQLFIELYYEIMCVIAVKFEPIETSFMRCIPTPILMKFFYCYIYNFIHRKVAKHT